MVNLQTNVRPAWLLTHGILCLCWLFCHATFVHLLCTYHLESPFFWICCKVTHVYAFTGDLKLGEIVGILHIIKKQIPRLWLCTVAHYVAQLVKKVHKVCHALGLPA